MYLPWRSSYNNSLTTFRSHSRHTDVMSGFRNSCVNRNPFHYQVECWSLSFSHIYHTTQTQYLRTTKSNFQLNLPISRTLITLHSVLEMASFEFIKIAFVNKIFWKSIASTVHIILYDNSQQQFIFWLLWKLTLPQLMYSTAVSRKK